MISWLVSRFIFGKKKLPVKKGKSSFFSLDNLTLQQRLVLLLFINNTLAILAVLMLLFFKK